QIMERRYVVQGPAPRWRDYRYTISGKAEGATKMRIAATDNSLGPHGWLAVSAPRAPQLVNMTEFVGDQSTFVEWTAALVHPCLQIPGIHNGIAEIPKFRVAAGAEVRDVGQGWSSPDAGGPFGWMNVATSMRELPTYLRNNIHRDWGSLYAVDPYEPDALPAQSAMEVHTETHWGTWSPGPLTKTVQLPGDVPSSNDRNDIVPFEAFEDGEDEADDTQELPGREEAGGPGERASGLLLSEESPGNRRAGRSPRANRAVAAGHRVVAWGHERTTTSAGPA